MSYSQEYGFTYGGVLGTDHVAEGLGRLLEQYKEQPNIRKLLSVYLAQIQKVGNVITALFDEELLDNASGFLLEVFGAILQIDRRDEWTEEQYRFWLKTKVRALRSNGRKRDLYELAELMIEETSSATPSYFPQYPAAFRLEVPDVDPAFYGIAAELLALASPAGCRATFVFYQTQHPFSWDKAPGTTYGWANGVWTHIVPIEEI